MNLLEKAAVIHYHRKRIDEYAPGTVEALGYRGPESQNRRFEALAGVGDLNDVSVLDVGCGHGDLKGFLDGRFRGFSYIGIDMVPEFIAQARNHYGQRPSCYFCLADLAESELPKADYVFASGVLGYRSAAPDYRFSMIKKMYEAANRALAFNMLDAAVFPDHPLLVGHDPEAVLAYCKTLASDARLVRGYLEDDFTVLMYT